MTWNLPTIAVLSVLIVAVALIVRGMLRGSVGGCDGDCSSCGSACSSPKIELSQESLDKLARIRAEGEPRS